MKFDFEFITVIKLGDWAIELPDDIDFIDYWYNLALSKTKWEIESNFMNSINAFHWTLWQDRFEELTDGYNRKSGEGFCCSEREWFAHYTQYLVYAFQMSSKELAEYYGLQFYVDLMRGWGKYHILGVDQFVHVVGEDYGLPTRVEEIVLLDM